MKTTGTSSVVSIIYKHIISPFVWVLGALFSLVPHTGPKVGADGAYDLFPTSFFKSISAVSQTVRECSTKGHESLFVISNGKVNGHEMVPIQTEENLVPYPNQQPSPISDHSKSPKEKLNKNTLVNEATDTAFISLSPVSSIKSHNSMNSSNDGNSSERNTAMSSVMSSGSNEELDSEGDVYEGGKLFECDHCDAKFRLKGYLTRHVKKHLMTKAYHCPFHQPNLSKKCHPTGGFSRRDTFKTHLKSRHFKYPPGVKSSSRTGMVGWCGICGERFVNNEIWVERHIEGGKCPGLPKSYLESLNPGRKKTGKHSKFLDVKNIDESIQLGESTRESNHLTSRVVSPTITDANTPSPHLSFGDDQKVEEPQSHYGQPDYLSHQIPTPTNSLPFMYNPQKQQNHIIPQEQMDPEVALLIKRKAILQQYITALQKAAALNVQTGVESTYTGNQNSNVNFNPNCLQPLNVKRDDENDFPSLDSEYSSYDLNQSTHYPVNLPITNRVTEQPWHNIKYGVSLEES